MNPFNRETRDGLPAEPGASAQRPTDPTSDPSGLLPGLTEERLQAWERTEMVAAHLMQLEEMERYRWCLGVQLGYDPCRDRTVDEIRVEWILRYAPEFRREWQRRRLERLRWFTRAD